VVMIAFGILCLVLAKRKARRRSEK